jgi:ribosome-binding factor A
MKVDRLTRVNELLRREIGLILYRVIDRSVIDVAAVTITHVSVSSDLRTARVLVSVRGDETLHERALHHLRARRAAIQEAVAETVVLKYTPRLHFDLDRSVEVGDRVLTLLAKLEPSPPGSMDSAKDPPDESN